MKREKLIAARERMLWDIWEASRQLEVSAEALRKWESGEVTPQFASIKKLCMGYRATPEELGLGQKDLAKEMLARAQGESRVSVEEVPDVVPLGAFQMEDLTLCLQRSIRKWVFQGSQNYQMLQGKIVEQIKEDCAMNQDEYQTISRRDALRRIVLLGIEGYGLSMLGPVLRFPYDEILTHCAAGIAVCWQMRKGEDLELAARAVDAYLPTLHAISQSSSTQHSHAAADLLVQCYLLRSTLARHVGNVNDGVTAAQQAETYGEMGDNRISQALAFRTQAAAHFYANHGKQALEAGTKALYLLENSNGAPVPRLVQSYIYAGLATYQAREGQMQEALTSLRRAHDAFAAQPPNELPPMLVYTDYNLATLTLLDGMTHLHLGLYKDAFDTFAKINDFQDTLAIVRIEAMIAQVMAEVSRDDKQRDMYQCIDLWKPAIGGAIQLHSEQRYNEGIQAYFAMCGAWPREKAVRDLREYVVHWGNVQA